MKARAQGNAAEVYAANLISQHGYKIIRRNYFSRYGEIDIIAQSKNCILFIEVRYRKQENFGGAAASVSYSKQQKIIKTASMFLVEHPQYNHYEARFDVIALNGDITGSENWIEAAFTL